MGWFDWWGTRFEDFYSNPDAVTIAFFVIVLLSCYSVLAKTNLKKSPGVVWIVSLCISLIFVFYFVDLYYYLLTFNILLVLAVCGIVIVLFMALLRFIRAQG